MMSRLLSVIMLLLCAVLLSGCTAYMARILPQPPMDSTGFYEDNDISIDFDLAITDYISFVVRNRSSDVITLLWDDVSIVDADGNVSRVIHYGVKYIDAGKSMPPISIPPGAELDELVIPANRVYYSSGEWRTMSIVPGLKTWCFSYSSMQQYHGKTVTILLPFLVGNERRNYTFIFMIDVIDSNTYDFSKATYCL